MKLNRHTFDLSAFLLHNRDDIIREWVSRLHADVGYLYSQRPLKELIRTVSEAFYGDFHVLVHNDFTYIDRFIEKITQIRLETKFSLSQVQKAFEIYRSIVIPLLAKETAIDDFLENVIRINQCLSYTIQRFSDYFQAMHERTIREHNLRLEKEVRVRTAELRESELKYKTLVEEITDGYFVIQEEVIVFANRAFCKMHGYSAREVIGEKFYHFIVPEHREQAIEMYNKSILKKPAPRIFEYLRLTKEGRTFPTEITARRTHFEDRLWNIGICRDMTERIEMEQRVRKAEQMAYIGQLTTSLSHEIRNPLSAVKMNLQILRKNDQIRGNDQRRVDISVREVIRLEGILKELLDFAKPLRLNIGECDINRVLCACVELLEIKFEQKKLAAICSFHPEVPMIRADQKKLEQAFINLLLNAFEASDPRGKILITTCYASKEYPPGLK
ncbi:two-component system sensor histidine kinase NtrB [Desulfonema magnum]|uniref:histidine kinase n=1 Tax=Desulfonema magnum TaxID=45655 RepID=A0A975BT45_9BACT|nr:PAS domain S-box protein [Desulfonema magnum]QTA91117.1 Two component system histidine kinase, PAS domain-containing [Desulfonema magnum]